MNSGSGGKDIKYSQEIAGGILSGLHDELMVILFVGGGFAETEDIGL